RRSSRIRRAEDCPPYRRRPKSALQRPRSAGKPFKSADQSLMSTTVETIEAMERPPVTMASRVEGELLEVSMGPQHPSTHGVFRMNVALEGEIVRKLKPVFGYLHRNHEKIGENTSYLGSMPYTDRLDYFCSMTNNWAYALSVEKLAGIEVPERAEYLRI